MTTEEVVEKGQREEKKVRIQLVSRKSFLCSNILGSTGQSVSSGMCIYVSIYFPFMFGFLVQVEWFPRILCDSLDPYPTPLMADLVLFGANKLVWFRVFRREQVGVRRLDEQHMPPGSKIDLCSNL